MEKTRNIDVQEAGREHAAIEDANSGLRVFAQFCETSSIPALPKIGATKSVAVKTVWLLILLGGTSIFLWQATVLINQYMGKPVAVAVTVVNQKVIDFPSVTICNLNPLRASKLDGTRFWQLVTLDQTLENAAQSPDNSGSADPFTQNNSSDSQTSIDNANAPTGYQQAGGGGDTGESANDGVVLQEDFSYLQQVTSENDFLGMMKVSISDDYADILKLIRLTRQEARDYGHTAEDMILTCSFDGFECAPKDFYMFEDKKYGRCYTFNSAAGTKILRTTRFGIQNGLQLILNPEIAEYVGLLTPSKGFRVVVHHHDVPPYPQDFGLNAATGATTLIGIQKNMVKRLQGFTACTDSIVAKNNNTSTTVTTTTTSTPSPTAAGANSPRTNQPNATGFTEKVYGYSMQSCVEDCLQTLLISTCNCSEQMQDTTPTSSALCSFLNENQTHCRDNVYKQYSNGSLSCDCPQQCTDIYYSSSISSSAWPLERYSRILSKKLGKRLNGTSFDQLVNVKVYFQELNYQYIEESEGYSIEKLLADLGGIIGLYIGMCVCSMFEIFEFFFILAQMAWISMKRNKIASDKSSKRQAWIDNEKPGY